jgi:hypothetical protein
LLDDCAIVASVSASAGSADIIPQGYHHGS